MVRWAQPAEPLLGGRSQWAALLVGCAMVATLLTPVERAIGADPGERHQLGATLATDTPADTADTAAAVTVPRHRSDLVGLQLLGASPTAFLIRQPGRGINGTGRLLAGTRNSTLKSMIDPGDYQAGYDVTGRIFSWADTLPATPGWQVHRIDLVTGKEHSYRSPDQPVAWTPTGWIGWHSGTSNSGTSNSGTSNSGSSNSGTLVRHVAGGSQRTVLRGLWSSDHGSPNRPEVLADGTAALVRGPVLVNGVAKDRIMLIPFTGDTGRAGQPAATADPAPTSQVPTAQVLASVPYTSGVSETPAYGLGSETLSDSTVTWLSWTSPGGSQQVLHQRDRSTGRETSLVLPTDLDLTTMTAAGDRVAMLRSPGVEGSSQVAVLSGGLWRTVSLPGPTTTLRAAGSEFFVAVDGPAATAGVYAIGSAGADLVASVPSQPVGVTALSLSAGRLSYLDAAVHNGQNGAVWQRAVGWAGGSAGSRVGDSAGDSSDGSTGDSTGGIGRRPALKLGAEHRLTPAEPLTDGPSLAMALSTSAGRAIVQSRTATPANYRLLDRGTVQRVLPIGTWPNSIRASGGYALVGSQVFTAGGDPVLDLTAENLQHADLFGTKLIYDTADGTVWLRDVSKPVSMLTPITLAASPACARDSFAPSCASEVAIWGDTVAWARRDGTISIRTLPDRATRQVVGGEWVSDLRLSEGALAWRTPYAGGAQGDSDSLRLLDLKSPTSTPVTVSGLTAVSVDDHLLAGISAAGLITVRTLPFGRSTKYPPRLLDISAPSTFTATNVGAGAGVWSLEIDASKPLTAVTLTLSRAGSAVRTLHGSAPDGSIRDLTWDGLDNAGAPAPTGVYSWALTASAKDGGGRLTTADGALITGTLRLGHPE